MNDEKHSSPIPISEADLNEVVGGASKTVAKRDKRQIEGRNYNVKRQNDGTPTKVLPITPDRTF